MATTVVRLATEPNGNIGLQLTPETALGMLPARLRTELLVALNEVVKNFREGRWEPSELNAGKLCEVIYSILRGFVDGRFPSRARKPRNMVDACKELEKVDATRFPRAVRIQVPRVIVALYEIRNNRGVGHVGGDVDPNHMDATMVMSSCKWLVSELVRMFHNTDVATAALIVDALVEREVPLVWEVGGKKRILALGLSMMEETLLLLYASAMPLHEDELLAWTEHTNRSVYRKTVLVVAHTKRLVEYDPVRKTVTLSPRGSKFVEANIPLTL